MQLSGFSAPLQLHHENELKPCNLKLSVVWIPVPQCTSRAIWTQASRKKNNKSRPNGIRDPCYTYNMTRFTKIHILSRNVWLLIKFFFVCVLYEAPDPPLSPAMLTTSRSSQGPSRSFRFITISIIPLIIQQQRD